MYVSLCSVSGQNSDQVEEKFWEVKMNTLLLHRQAGLIWESIWTVATKGWKQRLPFIFKLKREYEYAPIFGIYLDTYHTESFTQFILWSLEVRGGCQLGCTVPTSANWKKQLHSCLCKSIGNNKQAHSHSWLFLIFRAQPCWTKMSLQ